MGFALPAAFGARMGDPKRQVVSVMGDGGFQMAMPELATLMQYGAEVKAVVLRNGTLGMVYEYQKHANAGRYTMVDISGAPELSKIAEAYGIDYVKVDRGDDYGKLSEEFLKRPGTGLMEVIIDPEEGVKA